MPLCTNSRKEIETPPCLQAAAVVSESVDCAGWDVGDDASVGRLGDGSAETSSGRAILAHEVGGEAGNVRRGHGSARNGVLGVLA